jgi:uncharacterized damage-inducible protein DinB
VLESITAAQAARQVWPGCNSIWQIVNHMIAWRRNVLKRVQGKTLVTPAHNYFEPVAEISDKAWKAALRTFAATQKSWLQLLNGFDRKQFEKIYPPNGLNYYEHIQGILQHDAYHLGQIVLLAKMAE